MPQVIKGSIGVGTWETSAEYKDIRVEKAGQVLYESDFSKDADQWKTDGGNWSVVDGAYRQSSRGTGLSFFGDENWSDYTLTLKARKLSGTEGFLICFARKGQERNWWNIGGWGNTEHAIEFNQTSIGPHVPGSIEANRWYNIKVSLEGARIRCYLDDKLIHDEKLSMPQGFFATAGRDETSGALVIKAINAASEPVNATINLGGVKHIAFGASLTVLKSNQPGDNNSLQNPKMISPVTSIMPVSGNTFTHEFPAYSFSIMRLAAKGTEPIKSADSK
jgi:alpha-L-arabinofuranosidase